jgi:hypothetical protein
MWTEVSCNAGFQQWELLDPTVAWQWIWIVDKQKARYTKLIVFSAHARACRTPSNELFGYVKGGELFDQLSEYPES